MAAAVEAVKESLLGTEDEPGLSAQTRADFLGHAKKDGDEGEHYLDETSFVDAIAPEGEDYVSTSFLPSSLA